MNVAWARGVHSPGMLREAVNSLTIHDVVDRQADQRCSMEDELSIALANLWLERPHDAAMEETVPVEDPRFVVIPRVTRGMACKTAPLPVETPPPPRRRNCRSTHGLPIARGMAKPRHRQQEGTWSTSCVGTSADAGTSADTPACATATVGHANTGAGPGQQCPTTEPLRPRHGHPYLVGHAGTALRTLRHISTDGGHPARCRSPRGHATARYLPSAPAKQAGRGERGGQRLRARPRQPALACTTGSRVRNRCA